MKNSIFILFRFFVFGAVLTSCGASLEKSKSQIEFSSMNTQMTVTAYGKNSEQAVQAAKDEIINLESLLSVTREDSDVYRINNAAGKTISVNDKTISVISLALKIAEETDGKFNPALYPVLGAWGFTKRKFRVPPQQEIALLLRLHRNVLS